MGEEDISYPAMTESRKDAEQLQTAHAVCGMPRSIEDYYGENAFETKLVLANALKKSRHDNATLAEELRESRNGEQLLCERLEGAKSALRGLKYETDDLKIKNNELKLENGGLKNEITG